MNSRSAAKIGLVDPIRTSKAFIPELERRKVDYVVIESGLMGGAPVEPIEVVAERLRKARVTSIIGCVDPSITYADRLSALLGLPFNGLRLSEARRNKVLMNEAGRKANLRAPLQVEATDVKSLLAWVASTGYPVVVKPTSSGGTDNVYRCDSDAEVEAAFHKILDKKNLMGSINTSVMAQELVDGIEYVIDCVSFEGVHASIDFFEYQKGTHNGRAFIYEKERFLRSDDPISLRLRSFGCAALEALEFRTGASHMEVKIDSKGDIVFIEVGPRLNGGDIYLQVQQSRADGKSQMEYALDAALGLPAPDSSYRTANESVRVYIVSGVEGTLKEVVHLDEIEALGSYTRRHLNVEAGQPVVKTTDLTNDAGWIDLSNPDPGALRRDEERLDEILAKGVLVLA